MLLIKAICLNSWKNLFLITIFTPSGLKDMGIRKFKFIAKPKFILKLLQLQETFNLILIKT